MVVESEPRYPIEHVRAFEGQFSFLLEFVASLKIMANGIFQNLFLPFSFSLTARVCNILDPFAISVDWLIYSLLRSHSIGNDPCYYGHLSMPSSVIVT